MTAKPNDVRVSRELLERLCLGDASKRATASQLVNAWAAMAEVRALLAQPADQQGEPVTLPEVLPLNDARCPRHHLIADGFRSGADWMRREVAKLGPLYRHAQPATAKVDENAEFEKWRDEQCASLERTGHSEAAKKFRELGSIHWAGWQARAKLNTPQ